MKEEDMELKGKAKKLKKKTVEEAPSEEESMSQMEFETNTECPKCGEEKIIS
jgi:predicted RNA-binding Zn-ribbon protein involved in translation (DUF1610 family)